MLLTVHQSRPEGVETGRRAQADQRVPEVEGDEARPDTSPDDAASADECTTSARDEMWSRWA